MGEFKAMSPKRRCCLTKKKKLVIRCDFKGKQLLLDSSEIVRVEVRLRMREYARQSSLCFQRREIRKLYNGIKP